MAKAVESGGSKLAKASVKVEKRKAQWLGAQTLMAPTKPGTKEDSEKSLVLIAARVLRISPFGVNILGNVPYINKLGLGQKAAQYVPQVRYKYRWIHVAEDDTQKAICECKITRVEKGKEVELSDWIMGECSPSSMKMGTLKGYQNHMAQTRAKNRAILETFGVRIHEDMMENIQRLQEGKAITDTQALRIGGSVASSAEEVNQDKPSERATENTIAAVTDSLMEYARSIGAEPGLERAFIEYKLGRSIEWKDLNAKELSVVRTQLMAKVTS